MLGLIISAVMHKHQQTDKLASSRQKVHLIPPKRWPCVVWRLCNNEAWERNTENIVMRLLCCFGLSLLSSAAAGGMVESCVRVAGKHVMEDT